VTDANIWIDLQAGGILDLAFRLPFTWHAPDILLAEFQHDLTADTLIALGVQSIELSGDQVLEVVQLGGLYLALSLPDLAALVVARSLNAVLLTGDRRLRDAAVQEGLIVHGTLWLLDRLLEHDVAGRSDAAAALHAMFTAGRRLPAGDVQRRLRSWGWRA
jgi:hypothetical protein